MVKITFEIEKEHKPSAEKYANETTKMIINVFEIVGRYEGFKAGAEWMAWQGVKIGETKIYLEDDGDEPPYLQEWLDLESTEFKLPDGVFQPGDEVEVILRKKQ